MGEEERAGKRYVLFLSLYLSIFFLLVLLEDGHIPRTKGKDWLIRHGQATDENGIRTAEGRKPRGEAVALYDTPPSPSFPSLPFPYSLPPSPLPAAANHTLPHLCRRQSRQSLRKCACPPQRYLKPSLPSIQPSILPSIHPPNKQITSATTNPPLTRPRTTIAAALTQMHSDPLLLLENCTPPLLHPDGHSPPDCCAIASAAQSPKWARLTSEQLVSELSLSLLLDGFASKGSVDERML